MTEVTVQKMVPAAMVSLREKVQAWRVKKKASSDAGGVMDRSGSSGV